MQKEYRRLFSLNLALLMLLTVMGPLSGPAAKASDDTVYTIDGQSFTENDSEDGWSYKNNILTLENYTGGAIVFPGSVTIQVSGSCSVTAAEGAGISATQLGIKFLPGASLRVAGGSGSPAVQVTTNRLDICLPGELTAISGGSGVPALQSPIIKIGGASGNVNKNVSVKAGNDEQSLEVVASYSGEACVRAFCDQVVLRFDPNGGTLNGETGVQATTVPYGMVTAFFPQVEKAGCYLRSWKSNSKTYHLKDSFLPDDIEVTFTAQWNSLPTNADYLLFVDGYHDSYTKTYSTDGTMTIPSNFTMDGKTFLGWSRDANFSADNTVTELYWPGETVSNSDIPSGTMLYGVYGDGTDYLTYAGNGGTTSAGGSYVAVRGDTVLGISGLFTWEGHRPQDWNTKRNSHPGRRQSGGAGDLPDPVRSVAHPLRPDGGLSRQRRQYGGRQRGALCGRRGGHPGEPGLPADRQGV